MDWRLLRDWVMNWWAFPLVVVGCLIMARRRWSSAKDSKSPAFKRIASLGFVGGAIAIMTVAVPLSWSLQQGFRSAHSVGLQAPSELQPVPAQWKAMADEFGAQTRAGLRRYSVAGIVNSESAGPLLVLARLERNHYLVSTLTSSLGAAPTDLGQHTNFGAASAIFGCTHITKGTSQASPSGVAKAMQVPRCEWRHDGSTAVVIPLAATINWTAVQSEASQLQHSVLVTDESRYHPFQLGGKLALDLLIAVLFGIVSIIGHELSHAGIARLVGSRVIGVTIGIGPTLWSGTIRNVEVEWRKLPIGGYVRHQRPSSDHSRWRPMSIAAAGPLFNLMTGGALFAIMHSNTTLGLIGIGLGLVNLIPYSVLVTELNVRVGTDGYQILRYIRQPRVADQPLPVM
jgi:hypothetical protein